MLGLTKFVIDQEPPLPKYDPLRAEFVLSKIDQILQWEQKVENERESRFVELGRYLCEVRAGQYWRMENLHSFDGFLERRFPGSRRKAYYFMSIHEHLPRQMRKDLREIGWSKAAELVKVARSDGTDFESAPWLDKARSLSKEVFRQEVEQHLTGKGSEPYDIVYFKFYKTQLEVIEQALETAALMLGSDKSRGYCLEMICADFLAGVNLEGGNPDVVVSSIYRCFSLIPQAQQSKLLQLIGQAL